jgi:hypothetical protein
MRASAGRDTIHHDERSIDDVSFRIVRRRSLRPGKMDFDPGPATLSSERHTGPYAVGDRDTRLSLVRIIRDGALVEPN